MIRRVAERKGSDPGDVTVIMLDRERHAEAVEQVREVGARIRFITDGDVSAALFAVSQGTGVDLLWGIGGTPEGVISAAAIKCLGGQILGRLWPRDDEERKAAVDAGYDLEGSSTPTTWCAATTSFSPPPGSPTASCCRASATSARQRDNRVAGHALALGHGPQVQARHDRPKLREVTGGRYG